MQLGIGTSIGGVAILRRSEVAVPSYADPRATGDRTALITITSAISLTGPTSYLVNGVKAIEPGGPYLQNLSTTNILTFDVGTPKVINEVIFYQSTNAAHGTWKWQGSPDDSTYADVGSTFTLGGVLTQTITTVSGNTTRYRYYRLTQTAGQASSGPYLIEFEFKIG